MFDPIKNYEYNLINAGSNPKNLTKAVYAMLRGKPEEAKQYLKANMDSIEKYWKNPARRKMFLLTLKVKMPEVYSQIVKVGKEKEKQDRMSGKQKKENSLKKALTGDFYYADYAYGEALKILEEYYKGIQTNVLQIEDPNKGQDGMDRAV